MCLGTEIGTIGVKKTHSTVDFRIYFYWIGNFFVNINILAILLIQKGPEQKLISIFHHTITKIRN